MEYTSLSELYRSLIPVFNVKRRLLSISNCAVTNEDIWKYLAASKWRNSIGLTLADMVNDIITVDIDSIIYFKGGKNEKR